MAPTLRARIDRSIMTETGSGPIQDVLAELQGAFSDADADLAEAIMRTKGSAVPPVGSSSLAPPPSSTIQGETAEWDHLSRLLQHAGFAPLALEKSDDSASLGPTPHAIREALVRVLEGYEQQQAALQRALEEQVAVATEKRLADHAQGSAADAELGRANAALEAQLEVARGRLREQTEEAEAAAKSAEHALGSLRHKLATQTGQLKAKEAEVRRLQERLAKDLSERDAAQKQRERQIFQEVHRRAAKPSSPADARSLELITVYEGQRRNLQGEIDELRATNRQLSGELAERENLIARKDSFRSWRTPDEGALLGKLQDAQRGERRAREEIEAVQARAAEQLRAARTAAAEARQEAEVERARAAALELDLSARPTVQQLSDAKATVEALKGRCPPRPRPRRRTAGRTRGRRWPAAATRPRGGGLRPLPPVDSEAAIRRDKEVHELGLHTLATMPPQDMLRLLQDACRELQLHDAALLPAALRKMCRALAALPPMEAFVRDVCAVALSAARPPVGAALPPADGGCLRPSSCCRRSSHGSPSCDSSTTCRTLSAYSPTPCASARSLVASRGRVRTARKRSARAAACSRCARSRARSKSSSSRSGAR